MKAPKYLESKKVSSSEKILSSKNIFKQIYFKVKKYIEVKILLQKIIGYEGIKSMGIYIYLNKWSKFFYKKNLLGKKDKNKFLGE